MWNQNKQLISLYPDFFSCGGYPDPVYHNPGLTSCAKVNLNPFNSDALGRVELRDLPQLWIFLTLIVQKLLQKTVKVKLCLINELHRD